MSHNNVIPNQHFKKKWQFYVKTWFNQPARKTRRQNGEQRPQQRSVETTQLKQLVLTPQLADTRPVVQPELRRLRRCSLGLLLVLSGQ